MQFVRVPAVEEEHHEDQAAEHCSECPGVVGQGWGQEPLELVVFFCSKRDSVLDCDEVVAWPFVDELVCVDSFLGGCDEVR